MRALLILGLLQAPAASDDTPTLGIAWHQQATVAAELQQRLVQDVATAAGIETGAVDRDVVGRARWIVAFEVERGRASVYARARDDLDRAAESHRSRDLATAEKTVDEVLDALSQAAVVPGVAALMRRAHVLRARIAQTRGDSVGVDEALDAALTLDPTATLSTREVPPAVSRRYAALQREVMGGRDRWIEPRVTLPATVVDPTLAIEIDGVPGLRPVPPGKHVLVARRSGVAPVGAHVDVAQGWSVPASTQRLAPGVPTRDDPAQVVCNATGVETLVLARARGRRVGLQAYRCGVGFGSAWYGKRATLDEGVRAVLAPSGARRGSSSLLDDGRWTPTPRIRAQGVTPGTDTPPPTRPKWYQRSWVWLLIGGVVLAGVATGVALGTESSRPAVAVDGDSFR